MSISDVSVRCTGHLSAISSRRRPTSPGMAAPEVSGAINTGVGLEGDGSAGSPLRVSLPTYADLEALP